MTRDVRSLAIAGLLLSLTGLDASGQVRVSGTVRDGGRAVRNAAVYLVPVDAPGAWASDASAEIDQLHLTFTPQVVVVPPGADVTFVNSDDVLHNVFGPGFGGLDGFDLGTYPRDARRTLAFEQEGLHVVLCHIHPEMAAFVIVTPTDYKTMTARDGFFEFDGIEPGRYRLHAWHPMQWTEEHVEEIVIGDGDLEGLTLDLGRRGLR